MKVHDVVWVKAIVAHITPNAIVVNLHGPRGTVVQANLDPDGPIIPKERPPEPEEPTQGA